MRSVVVLLAVLLSACNSAEQEQQRTEAEKARQQHASQYSKERAEELALMSDSERAVPELQRRLAQWLTSSDGAVYLSQGSAKFPQIYAMPDTTGWLVACSFSGIKITVGPWTDVDEGTGGSTFERILTRVPLSSDQCGALLPPLSATMNDKFRSRDVASFAKPMTPSRASPAR